MGEQEWQLSGRQANSHQTQGTISLREQQACIWIGLVFSKIHFFTLFIFFLEEK